MKISIVIPTYNCAQYLPRCIESVKAQTHLDWECVIVDDGSGDDTRAVVLGLIVGDPRFMYFQLASNVGLSEARNTGIRESSKDSDAFFFLDADDWIEPETLAFLEDQAALHPEAGRIISPCMTHWWYENPKIRRSVPWAIEPVGVHGPDSPHLFSGNACDPGHCTGCLYVRRLIDPSLLWFNPRVFRFEDMIMNMGLIFSGVTTVITDRYLYNYRRRVGSITLNPGYTDQNVADSRDALATLAYRYPPERATYIRCKNFLEDRLKQALR